MKVSEIPELREYRDELARKIHKRHGGEYLDAVTQANVTARRIYVAGVRVAEAGKRGRGTSGRAISESVTRVVREVRRTKGVTETAAPKPKPRKGQRRKAIVAEAVRQAVAKAVTEAGNGALAARVASPAAASRPLAEMDADELAAQVEEVFSAAAKAGTVPVGGGDWPVAESGEVSLPDTPLHKLDAESWEDLAPAVLAQGGAGHRSPFWAGADAARSPFWRGLDG